MSGCPNCGTPATCVQATLPLTRTVDGDGCIVIGISGVTCYTAGTGITFTGPDPGTGCYVISTTGSAGAPVNCYSAGSNITFGPPNPITGCLPINAQGYAAGTGVTFSAPAPITGIITVSTSAACYTAGNGISFGAAVGGCFPIDISPAELTPILQGLSIYPIAAGSGIGIGVVSGTAFISASIAPGATFKNELFAGVSTTNGVTVSQPGGSGTNIVLDVPPPTVGGVSLTAPATVLMNPGDFVEWGAPGDVLVTVAALSPSKLLQMAFSTKAPSAVPIGMRIYIEQEGPPATWTAITSTVAPSTSRSNEAQGVIMRPSLNYVLPPGSYRLRARAFLDPAFVGTTTPAWVDGFMAWSLTV